MQAPNASQFVLMLMVLIAFVLLMQTTHSQKTTVVNNKNFKVIDKDGFLTFRVAVDLSTPEGVATSNHFESLQPPTVLSTFETQLTKPPNPTQGVEEGLLHEFAMVRNGSFTVARVKENWTPRRQLGDLHSLDYQFDITIPSNATAEKKKDVPDMITEHPAWEQVDVETRRRASLGTVEPIGSGAPASSDFQTAMAQAQSGAKRPVPANAKQLIDRSNFESDDDEEIEIESDGLEIESESDGSESDDDRSESEVENEVDDEDDDEPPCPEGKERHHLFKRCVNECPDNKERNAKGNCVIVCKPGTVRNPATGRCINANGALAKKQRLEEGSSSSQPVFVGAIPEELRAPPRPQLRVPAAFECPKQRDDEDKVWCDSKEDAPKTFFRDVPYVYEKFYAVSTNKSVQNVDKMAQRLEDGYKDLSPAQLKVFMREYSKKTYAGDRKKPKKSKNDRLQKELSQEDIKTLSKEERVKYLNRLHEMEDRIVSDSDYDESEEDESEEVMEQQVYDIDLNASGSDSDGEEQSGMEYECESTHIRNPNTKRCVRRDGVIGKRLIADSLRAATMDPWHSWVQKTLRK